MLQSSDTGIPYGPGNWGGRPWKVGDPMSDDRIWFPEFAPGDLQTLATCGVVRTYPKNTLLISEGDPSHELYIVISGTVRAFASERDGREVTLSMAGPGAYFGELGLIDDTPRSASVMTFETTKVAVLSKADFHGCLSAHPELALKLMRALTQRVRMLTERLRNIALLDVYGRIARTFMELATECDGRLMINQRMTQQDIASMVGCAREMVARVMRELTVGGYIEVKDKRITILKKLPTGW